MSSIKAMIWGGSLPAGNRDAGSHPHHISVFAEQPPLVAEAADFTRQNAPE
jgi:hypothetical protein